MKMVEFKEDIAPGRRTIELLYVAGCNPERHNELQGSVVQKQVNEEIRFH